MTPAEAMKLLPDDLTQRVDVWAACKRAVSFRHGYRTGAAWDNYPALSPPFPSITLDAPRVYEAEGCKQVQYDDRQGRWTVNGSVICYSAVSATEHATARTEYEDTHYPHILALRDAKPITRQLTDEEGAAIAALSADQVVRGEA